LPNELESDILMDAYSSSSREVSDAFPESCHFAHCGLAGDGSIPTDLRRWSVSDGNPDRAAGAAHGHAGAAHADAGAADRYAGAASGHAGAADRYTSAASGHAGAAHAEAGSPNGYASAAACHADAAAVAHRHARRPAIASCDRGRRSRGLSSLVDMDARGDDAVGLRRDAVTWAKAEDTREIAV